jgi:hypothetical protein
MKNQEYSANFLSFLNDDLKNDLKSLIEFQSGAIWGLIFKTFEHFR